MKAEPERFRYQEMGSSAATAEASLARETALAISYNDISHAVMMVSPAHLEDYVTGFSLTNGIVESATEIYGIQLSGDGDTHYANVEISSRALWALSHSRRRLAGNSGCGICGAEAIEQALPALPSLPKTPLPPYALLENLRERITASQRMANASGALHAAIYLDARGNITHCREDIGRHNALDKLIGALAHTDCNPREGLVAVTSRCGLELVQKAVRTNIATLVCLSAPTSLTVQWARQHGLNLIHIPHHSAPRVYSPELAE